MALLQQQWNFATWHRERLSEYNQFRCFSTKTCIIRIIRKIDINLCSGIIDKVSATSLQDSVTKDVMKTANGGWMCPSLRQQKTWFSASTDGGWLCWQPRQWADRTHGPESPIWPSFRTFACGATIHRPKKLSKIQQGWSGNITSETKVEQKLDSINIAYCVVCEKTRIFVTPQQTFPSKAAATVGVKSSGCCIFFQPPPDL